MLQGSSLWKVAFQGKLFPELKKLDFKTCFLLAHSLIFFITVHRCSFPLGERFVWYLSGCNSPCATSGSYLMKKRTHISNSSEVDTERERDTTSTGKALRCYCEPLAHPSGSWGFFRRLQYFSVPGCSGSAAPCGTGSFLAACHM